MRHPAADPATIFDDSSYDNDNVPNVETGFDKSFAEHRSAKSPGPVYRKGKEATVEDDNTEENDESVSSKIDGDEKVRNLANPSIHFPI